MPRARYISVADVRAEGPPFSDSTTYNDAWVNAKIDLASEQIEKFTGNWFVPIEHAGAAAIKVDGSGGPFQPLPFPIVSVDSITLIYAERYGADASYEIDLSEVTVYNRHLTQGLVSPDDRKRPGLAIEDFLGYPKEDMSYWPKGRQNVVIEGTFGWTELAFDDTVGETESGSQIPGSEGSTPAIIKRACMLLVRRAWPKVGDYHGMVGVGKPMSSIVRMQARDQSVGFASPTAAAGATATGMMIGGTTGDPDIDRMLLGFRRAPGMEFA